MDRTTVLIRKYENRRLYDTAGSRYVNLDGVARIVREGFDVRVVDAVTGEDITRVVLSQIILESARAPKPAFPLDMLRQMVMISGHVSPDGMSRYLRTMFENYQNVFRAFAPSLNPFDVLGLGPLAPGAPPPAAGEEVGELRRRIEELENLVARSGATRPRRQKKAVRL